MLVAAALIAGSGVIAQRQRDAAPDAVEAAIAAPFTDVGIEPIDRAIELWRARADERPEDHVSLTRLATSIVTKARETGDLSLYGEAEGIVEKALTQNPSAPGALLALAGIRAANHDFAAALELAERVLAKDPSSDAAAAAIADANFELGRYALAEQQLRDLAADLGDSIAIESRLAKTASVAGRIDDAIAHAARAASGSSELDLRPSEAAYYRFQLAHFLYEAGRVDDANAAVDAALEIDPTHLPSRELGARVLAARGMLDESASAYEELLAVSPAADIHGELAKVYRALGRDEAAEREIAAGVALGRGALDLYPAERRHLASFFADVDPDTALDIALADFETRHDIGAYDTLAWAYFVNGRRADAHDLVDDMLAQGTRDAMLLYHAGMIERSVGHDERARALLRDALELNPAFDVEHAPRARRALAELT
jgi:tetratricopeptide (TPR) repeat protein